MTEAIGGRPESFHPLRNEIVLPPKPEGLSRRLERNWSFIRENWERGKGNLCAIWNDPHRGQALRDFPWHQPGHRCTLRYIFANLLGYPLPGKSLSQTSIYKRLAHARITLGLGRRTPDSTPNKTILYFTSEELAQLMVGFLTSQTPLS